ncbi:hypothetical protein DRE_00240 [Drechslerella stenobrocha 248]|uniref:F-box domain-containing protein n=1 Tax=Drechslerella stenobrocha 248 TaxID=1043628 RepID=W7II04_9PEZI|nr:hypothetical protein DRE_00240 [Drechslerella stenobrocha 248]
METLPREILDRILGDEELAPPDLAAASLACKWIHPSAISKLYRVCRYDHITLPSITLSFRKHGIHTRSLKVKLGFEEPSSEDSPYAGIPIISIFPFFPNLHTFVIEDVQSQPPAYIARILRAVITTNLKLKHLEISCFVLNRTYPEIPAIDPSASSELEQGSAAYAQLDSFGLSIYTSLVNHRVGTGEIVQRLSHFGLALGRSIETVSASAITLRSSLRRPFQPFEPAYPLPANAPIWRFPHLRKLYLSLDCFPHMDIPYMKAEFGKVEVLRVGGQGPPGFVAEDNSDVRTHATRVYVSMCAREEFKAAGS